MDDPNWGLWLGCSQFGEAACNVTHMVMMIMNVGIKYRHAIVCICSSCAFDDDSQCNMRTMYMPHPDEAHDTVSRCVSVL